MSGDLFTPVIEHAQSEHVDGFNLQQPPATSSGDVRASCAVPSCLKVGLKRILDLGSRVKSTGFGSANSKIEGWHQVGEMLATFCCTLGA